VADIKMSDSQFGELHRDMSQLKADVAVVVERMEGIDKAVISLAESQKMQTEIIADLREQRQLNASFGWRLDKTDKEIENLRGKLDLHDKNIFDNKSKIADISLKVGILIAAVVAAYPQVSSILKAL
jgi:hypothetical protein